MQVTDVHVLLYNTMMFCGVTPEMLFGRMEEERAKQLENVEFSNTFSFTAEQESIKRTSAAEALTMEERGSIWTENGSKQATSFQAPPVDPPVLKRAPPVQASAAEERDAKKPPKRLTHKNMLQWLTDKDGVSFQTSLPNLFVWFLICLV